MVTGYEQVRSVVADIAGDQEAAREVRLVLPETGVCNSDPLPQAAASGCCGGPAPAGVDACCVKDAEAKAAGNPAAAAARPGDRTGEQVVLLRSRRMRQATGGTARHGAGVTDAFA